VDACCGQFCSSSPLSATNAHIQAQAANAPSANRIFIEFRDANNNVVDSTSTAVSTNRYE
jgi:hypothetical protein